ncbi:hypothetical protein BDV93DRAFT_524963 [Ceratobasidium sp. AG-I]|nr:hypothetical protein BDV93DRAFT_524963 [Ceratobasidium sp. AG-I]
MSEHDTEVVWLSDLRFADLKPKEHLQTNRTEGTHQEQTGLPGIFPQYNESRAYDRLAADKPGEELTAEATIWKLYVSEAEDYDDELVDRQHRNIDVMLVFVRSTVFGNLSFVSFGLSKHDATGPVGYHQYALETNCATPGVPELTFSTCGIAWI